MKLKIARTVAAAAFAAVAVFALPTAAQADPYPEETPGAGVSVEIETPAGIFAANEQVDVFLSGEDANFASASQGIVRAVYVENAAIGSVTSEADGSVDLVVTLPTTAEGQYTVLLTSASRPQGYEVVISADGSVISGGVVAGGSTGSTGGLPATGLNSSSLLGLWVGGGALVLAGGAVAVGAAVHRQRKLADA